jgi:hypothetical protein
MSLRVPENVSDVTLDDATVLAPAGILFIGGAGDLKLTAAQSGTATFKNLAAGKFLNIRTKVAWSTGSSVSDVVRCW